MNLCANPPNASFLHESGATEFGHILTCKTLSAIFTLAAFTFATTSTSDILSFVHLGPDWKVFNDHIFIIVIFTMSVIFEVVLQLFFWPKGFGTFRTRISDIFFCGNRFFDYVLKFFLSFFGLRNTPICTTFWNYSWPSFSVLGRLILAAVKIIILRRQSVNCLLWIQTNRFIKYCSKKGWKRLIELFKYLV